MPSCSSRSATWRGTYPYSVKATVEAGPVGDAVDRHAEDLPQSRD
jgi:hypothetical protein